VSAGCPAGPWPVDPCRHSRADAPSPTSPADKHEHGAPLQRPAHRRATPAGRERWAETAPFGRDATQTDIYAPLRAAKGIALVTHATVRAHAGDLWWSRRAPLPKEEILDGRCSNEDQGAVGHDTACRHQPSATALHHGHHVHLRFTSVSRRCRLTSSAHPWRLML